MQTNHDGAAAAARWLAEISPVTRATWLAACALVRLPANEPPWRGTGIRVVSGQAYSLFAIGRIQWSPRDPSLYGGPRFHLWARIAGGGSIVNLTCDSGTFTADTSGEIELGLYMGMWKNDAGELATSPSLYERLRGHIDTLVVAWRGEPAAALAEMAELPLVPHFFKAEVARLAVPVPRPPGWNYLLETGHADIFSETRDVDGRPAIKLEADDDQGILRTPVDFPLDPDTRLSWRWRVTALPSKVAENSTHTHDYISLAAAFDNRRDLTWIWSSTLPPGQHFDCPIRAWTARETHLVVRSDHDGLGTWHAEERNVHANVAAAMGPPPRRIVAVWLIAVSSFQHGRARAEFADIVLHHDALTLRVL